MHFVIRIEFAKNGELNERTTDFAAVISSWQATSVATDVAGARSEVIVLICIELSCERGKQRGFLTFYRCQVTVFG